MLAFLAGAWLPTFSPSALLTAVFSFLSFFSFWSSFSFVLCDALASAPSSFSSGWVAFFSFLSFFSFWSSFSSVLCDALASAPCFFSLGCLSFFWSSFFVAFISLAGASAFSAAVSSSFFPDVVFLSFFSFWPSFSSVLCDALASAPCFFSSGCFSFFFLSSVLVLAFLAGAWLPTFSPSALLTAVFSFLSFFSFWSSFPFVLCDALASAPSSFSSGCVAFFSFLSFFSLWSSFSFVLRDALASAPCFCSSGCLSFFFLSTFPVLAFLAGTWLPTFSSSSFLPDAFSVLPF